jgi:hypothetical protein
MIQIRASITRCRELILAQPAVPFLEHSWALCWISHPDLFFIDNSAKALQFKFGAYQFDQR